MPRWRVCASELSFSPSQPFPRNPSGFFPDLPCRWTLANVSYAFPGLSSYVWARSHTLSMVSCTYCLLSLSVSLSYALLSLLLLPSNRITSVSSIARTLLAPRTRIARLTFGFYLPSHCVFQARLLGSLGPNLVPTSISSFLWSSTYNFLPFVSSSLST